MRELISQIMADKLLKRLSHKAGLIAIVSPSLVLKELTFGQKHYTLIKMTILVVYHTVHLLYQSLSVCVYFPFDKLVTCF